MMNPNLVVILGATASGKTKLAVAVANEVDAEIISADSRQVFKRMDIGTGKDLGEYSMDGRTIPYHLIDILEPGDRYHVDAFKNDFFESFSSITSRNKLPILCGGTGLYIQNILQNQPYTSVPVNVSVRTELELFLKEDLVTKLASYNMESTKKVDLNSKKRLIRAIEIAEYLKYNHLEEKHRPILNSLVFGLRNEVEITRTKILNRLDLRLKTGMIEEVAQLINDGVSAESLIFYGLEYKFIVNHLAGRLSFSELKEKLGTAICQYAKRQNTYFRKMEKDGIVINWLNASAEFNLIKQQVIEKVSDTIF